jgi:hypothetical protein
MIIGIDGIPIEKLSVRPDPNMEAVAAEYTVLLRASLAASRVCWPGSAAAAFLGPYSLRVRASRRAAARRLPLGADIRQTATCSLAAIWTIP